MLATAAGSVGELLMIRVEGRLVYPLVESGGLLSAAEMSPSDWPTDRRDPASSILVPCGCMLPGRKLSGLGDVSGSKEAPVRLGSSLGDGVWAVRVNGFVALSS